MVRFRNIELIVGWIWRLLNLALTSSFRGGWCKTQLGVNTLHKCYITKICLVSLALSALQQNPLNAILVHYFLRHRFASNSAVRNGITLLGRQRFPSGLPTLSVRFGQVEVVTHLLLLRIVKPRRSIEKQPGSTIEPVVLVAFCMHCLLKLAGVLLWYLDWSWNRRCSQRTE